MASVTLQNVTKIYRGRRGEEIPAVLDLSLEVPDKSFVVLLGPSGCATQSAPPITTAPVEQSETRFEVTPGVAANGHLDAVHRVIGRPGVIFVGEGSAARVKPLLAQEKKRTARLVGEAPIYDVIVGNGEGEVPLSKLERHMNRLPANISVKQMDVLESKLSALGSRVGPAAMPKGPMPAQAKMRGVQRSVRRR